MTKLFLNCLVSLLLFSTAISAQIPKTMSYQGVLADTSANAVADGNYNLTFRIYDVASGGTELWMETQTIPVVDGIFNAILGSTTSLNLPFDQPYWLGVSVEGGTELSPRIELTSVPYSLEPDSGGGASSLQINDLSDAKYIGHSLYLGSGSGDNDDGTENYNTAVGYIALQHNTSGYINTAVGGYALHSNTTGFGNTAAGYEALAENLTGKANTAVGFLALTHNSSVDSNSALGYAALYSNTSGVQNTAIGARTLYSNTIGGLNTSVGFNGLEHNTAGQSNTAIGGYALGDNQTGSHNTAMGSNALKFNQNGGDNTAIGAFALYGSQTGSENTAIGRDAGSSQTNLFNTTCLGFGAKVTSDNSIRIGNSNVSSIGGYAGWSNFSDVRYKQNIKEDVVGLDFIMGLRPITYNLDISALAEKLGEDTRIDKDGNRVKEQPSAEVLASRERKASIRQSGFAAQEVEELAERLGYDFGGVDKPENEDSFYGLRYAEFVVPLVKAVQEQQKIIEKLQEENEKQQQEINQLRSEINH